MFLFEKSKLGTSWIIPLLTVGLLIVALEHRLAKSGEVAGREILVRSESDLPSVTSGPAFRRSLGSPVAGAAWHGVALRRVLRDLTELTEIAQLRDRRVDPTRLVEFTASNQSRRDMLAALADAAGVEQRIVGHLVYWGPAKAGRLLRTLVAQREEELTQFVQPDQRAARERLNGRKELRWGDLTTPREVLDRVCESFRLRVANPEIIPHDLWEGAVLPHMSATEMLTVVLIQFDLTFAWESNLEAVRIVPISAESVEIEKTHRIPGPRLEAFEQWRAGRSELSITEARPHEFVVRGLVEDHEELADLLQGKQEVAGGPPENQAMVVPIDRRRFTLTITGVPAEAVIRELEKSGIEFEFDAEGFERAGVDFKTLISMNHSNAPPEEFFAALFDPLGVEFAISGAKVELRLKE